MPNDRRKQEYRNSLIASPPIAISQAVQTSTDNVKAEFGPVCKSKYTEITSDLKYMSQYHDLQAVFDSLKQDLNLQ